MPRNSNTATIKVMATQTMAPNAHFIVHFINEVGEVVADELEIELSDILQNYVSHIRVPNNLAFHRRSIVLEFSFFFLFRCTLKLTKANWNQEV